MTRSPKRLIPLLFIIAYSIFIIVQGLVMYSADVKPRQPDLSVISSIPVEVIEAILFIMLSVGSMMVIYNAFTSGTLIFSIAHIDFLFPTPISRKHVLLLQLIRDYLKYGIYVTFLFLMVGVPVYGALGVQMLPWGLVSIAGVTAMLLLVVNIAHTVNIIFTFGFERLKQAGIILKAILVIGPITAILYGVHQYITTGNSYASILWASNSPIISICFAPARWCAELLLAPLRGLTGEEWNHFALLWIFAAGSFALLMSRKENIYEPSLGISAVMARRRLAMRQGDLAGIRLAALREKGTKRASGLGIPPFGTGAMALLWKSLQLRYRVSKSQLLIMLIAPAVLVYVLRHSLSGKAESILGYLPFALLYVVWILSMMAPAEMRAELKQANILKSMPIAAWKVMFVGTLNSMIYLTAGIAVFSAAMWIVIPQTRGPVLIACALGAPFLGFANVSMTGIAGLLYPDNRDIAQNYLSGLISFLLVSLAVLPTIVLGAFCLYFLRTSLYMAVAVTAIANIAIGASGITISGLIFRKFDPTSD